MSASLSYNTYQQFQSLQHLLDAPILTSATVEIIRSKGSVITQLKAPNQISNHIYQHFLLYPFAEGGSTQVQIPSIHCILYCIKQ